MADAVRRVCVVDDDEGIRESLRFLLEEADYVVEEAADGAMALARLRADTHPRVMLLDRMMPRLDGIATLRALSAESQVARRTMVIFMTARNDPPDPETAHLLATDTVAAVSKPFDLEALLAAIEQAWQHLDDRT